jgi:hypothetical protein
VNLRRVHERFVAVENQKVLHISVCVWGRMGECVRVCVRAYAGAGVCLREYNLCDPACSAPPVCHITNTRVCLSASHGIYDIPAIYPVL